MLHDNSPILEIKNLSKKFGGLTAVDNITLSFYPYKLQSIIGPNGAGKTTLFNLLTGMFPPTSGHIFFRGKKLLNSLLPKSSDAELSVLFSSRIFSRS